MLGSSIENEEESALGVRAVGVWGQKADRAGGSRVHGLDIHRRPLNSRPETPLLQPRAQLLLRLLQTNPGNLRVSALWNPNSSSHAQYSLSSQTL